MREHEKELGVTMVPDAFASLDQAQAPDSFVGIIMPFAKVILQSGLAMGALTAVGLNLLFLFGGRD